jgi:hypothetical protein
MLLYAGGLSLPAQPCEHLPLPVHQCRTLRYMSAGRIQLCFLALHGLSVGAVGGPCIGREQPQTALLQPSTADILVHSGSGMRLGKAFAYGTSTAKPSLSDRYPNIC